MTYAITNYLSDGYVPLLVYRHYPQPTVSCLNLVSHQVKKFRELAVMDLDMAATNMDGWGVKRLFSHLVRRWLSKSAQPRESWAETISPESPIGEGNQPTCTHQYSIKYGVLSFDHALLGLSDLPNYLTIFCRATVSGLILGGSLGDLGHRMGSPRW